MPRDLKPTDPPLPLRARPSLSRTVQAMRKMRRPKGAAKKGRQVAGKA